MDDFYTSAPRELAYIKKLYLLKRRYPFINLFSAGMSVQGKKLYAIGIGCLKSPVIFAGAFHAQEWLTESLLVRLAEEICGQYAAKNEVRRRLCGRGIIIVPCVNPDGVELVLSGGASAGGYRAKIEAQSGGSLAHWNANICGVDINHNFNAGHEILRRMEELAGITGPAPRQFGGYYPESEPETRALVNLCRSFCASRVYAIHSQGEEIYYRYGARTPDISEAIAEVLAGASGYSLPCQEGLASHGGFKDWFISETGRPGFTIEIGRGKNPLPIDELSPIFARLYETLMLAAVL